MNVFTCSSCANRFDTSAAHYHDRAGCDPDTVMRTCDLHRDQCPWENPAYRKLSDSSWSSKDRKCRPTFVFSAGLAYENGTLAMGHWLSLDPELRKPDRAVRPWRR